MPKIVDHAERRHMLATTTATLIANKGLNKATVREVARAAGVSTGVVSHYYTDARELLYAAYLTAFESASRRFFEVLQRDDSLEGMLDALCSALPIEDDALHEWKVRLAFWGAGEFENEIKSVEAESSKQFRKLLARTLERLRAQGAVDLRASSSSLVRTIEVLLIGTAIESMVLSGVESKNRIRRRMKTQVIREITRV